MKIGYFRVFDIYEDPQAQVDALEKVCQECVFEDPSALDQPKLKALLEHMRPGDKLVVWKLERLRTRTPHLLKTIETLLRLQVGLEVITPKISATRSDLQLISIILQTLIRCKREFKTKRLHANITIQDHLEQVSKPKNTLKRISRNIHTSKVTHAYSNPQWVMSSSAQICASKVTHAYSDPEWPIEPIADSTKKRREKRTFLPSMKKTAPWHDPGPEKPLPILEKGGFWDLVLRFTRSKQRPRQPEADDAQSGCTP